MTQDEESIFAAAIEKSAAERPAFLDRACAGNSSLRARLGRLLEAHVKTADPIEPITYVLRPQVLEEQPGDRIDRYKLLQKIGEGGCGIVYLAEQQQPVRRQVALKVIKLGMDTKAVIARFEAERQALALMDHPNIAKVLDAGATATGRPFFVMELVRGVPITKFCDDNQLTAAGRLDLFAKVCQAIQHAHQKGIIHRDIKPSNILVTLNDGAAVPKVIDFGIAKATQGRLTDATLFTAFEQFIGTPAYMSPEQAEMSSLDIDTRSDIYSLGVLLYELLTGRTPFDPKSFLRAGVDEMRRKIRETEPPAPSRRLHTLGEAEQSTIAKMRSTVPAKLSLLLRGDLDWIVMRCLEKDRSRRYDTAIGLAKDIARHLHHEPVVARPPSAAYLLRKLVRRHRFAVAAGAAVAAALVLGTIVSSVQAIRATRAEREQARLRIEAEQSEREQTRLREEAQEAAGRAEAGEIKALNAATALRRTKYVAEMNTTQAALKDHNLRRAAFLLDNNRPAADEEDLRGFEWRYLWGQAHFDESISLGSYAGNFGGLAVSPDGSLLASDAAPNIEIRSLPARALIKTLTPGDEPELASGVLRFSPDGKWLVSGRPGFPAARRLRLWNTQTWEEAPSLREIGPPFVFARNGQVIIGHEGGAPNGHFSAWSTESWTKIADLPGLIGPGMPLSLRLQSIAVSSDGNRLFFGGHAEPGIRCWDLNQNLELAPLKPPFASWASSLAVTREGLLAASHENGKVTLWDIESQELLKTFDDRTSWVTTVAFSPDGSVLAAGGTDRTIMLYDTKGGNLRRQLVGHEGQIWALAFVPNGSELVSGSPDDHTLRLWNWRDQPDQSKQLKPAFPVAFVDSGRALLSWSAENGFRQHHLANGAWTPLPYQPVPANFNLINASARLSPNRSTLARIQPDGVQIWNLHTGQQENRLTQTEGRITGLAFSPDGSQLATIGRKPAPNRGFASELQLWNALDWSAEPLLTPVSGVPGRVEFSADGTLLGTQVGPTFLLYNLRSRQAPWQIESPGQNSAIAFSPDGSKVAFASLGPPGGFAIRVLDLKTQQLVATMGGHQAGIRSLAFAPDSRTLASCGDDYFVKLWSMVSFQEILTLPSLPTNSGWVMFSPDGTWLAVASADERIQLWHAPAFAQIEAAERTATKTAEETANH